MLFARQWTFCLPFEDLVPAPSPSPPSCTLYSSFLPPCHAPPLANRFLQKKVNSVLLLQSFRKTLYNWIFYDNPRGTIRDEQMRGRKGEGWKVEGETKQNANCLLAVEYITENLCWELKYFGMLSLIFTRYFIIF